MDDAYKCLLKTLIAGAVNINSGILSNLRRFPPFRSSHCLATVVPNCQNLPIYFVAWHKRQILKILPLIIDFWDKTMQGIVIAAS